MKYPEWDVDLLTGERLTVQIDYCPKCQGIWLTTGNPETLVNKSGADNDYQGKNPRGRDDDDEGGIGGFIRGIFD